ncbi:MAG: universal stress protein [Sandaracinaceae bacterium]
MPFATHILVPTDFSDASKLALKAAAMLAKELNAKVTAVFVHDPGALRPPAQIGYSPERQEDIEKQVKETVATQLDALRDKELQGVAALETVVLRDPSPANAITAYADRIGADLIVIATHGRTGLKHLLIGSVAERVVRHANVPVLTLRSKADD